MATRPRRRRREQPGVRERGLRVAAAARGATRVRALENELVDSLCRVRHEEAPAVRRVRHDPRHGGAVVEVEVGDEDHVDLGAKSGRVRSPQDLVGECWQYLTAKGEESQRRGRAPPECTTCISFALTRISPRNAGDK